MTEAAGASLIRASGVRKAYHSAAETVWAARDVDFTAHAGEFVCIYGASGSGKSTLLNLLAGLDLADSGEIRVDGVDVSAADEAQRAELRLGTVGVVFQEHNLIEEFTAAENVALPLEARGVPVGEAREEALAQLARVGLAGLEDRMPWQLSGGQRQRVGVARALTGQRAVLLADEPTGALDSTATRELFELIRKLCDDGVLAVVCSHDPHCREFADTVYEVVDGRLESRS
ncbi:ABC transporter ATP-binding protein [Streptomyces sp. KL2]|uniref:ABC transporter ATP-binding protein n=1 Tax=Streptomyces sp. KL2 TaxID=3050126 RepID=UPI00397DF782